MNSEEFENLTPSQKRVLALLDLLAGKNKVAEVTKGDIAKTLAISIKTVDRAITRLRSEGYIEAIPQYDKNGARLANSYKVFKRGSVFSRAENTTDKA